VDVTPPVPMQEFFSIGEVCALTDLKPHVLRYWESQFRFLNPAKNRSGNRVYKSREV
jgi:DNA-binding transcriptional MerR regulator